MRISLSFSGAASKFSEDFMKILTQRLKMKHVNLLPGASRKRETMIRLDPVDIVRNKHVNFSSLYWKKLMIDEFSSYNKLTFPKRYSETISKR